VQPAVRSAVFPVESGDRRVSRFRLRLLLHAQCFGDTRNIGMKKRVEQFAALGQEDRLEIFRLLVRAGLEGKCVDEVKRRLKMPGSTLSHHLDALTRSGLLAARRSGRFIYYAVNWREASGLIRFLVEDCCAEMNLGIGNAPVTLANLECCRQEQASPRVAKDGNSAKGEGNGRPKFDQGKSQREVRARS
jgi:ArsR family transcriptional regulator, arsenate/arsenite/antimonite-responsive transcriptional repressor